ncbi:MAG TPA: DUF4037 domain-containing protein [Enhygromyxa sp.]|nr:DUF4037 domain-containing protein [Enhygromyxa sp.]
MVAALREAQVFIPGRVLNRQFFHEVIQPILAEQFPGLVYAAGLMGHGSDVLGFDTPRSMDHNWGPRGMIFLAEPDFEAHAEAISRTLAERLPTSFLGFPTNFTAPSDGYLVQRMAPIDEGPVNHLVKVFTVRSFVRHYLGFDPNDPITIADWLTFPQQALLEVVSGEVHCDPLGTLAATRARFAFYPRDVWLYCMACQWGRIANELSFQARSGERGDELGSRIIAARMVEEIMQLCFLLERTYIPYSKWRGTAFAQLECAKVQRPLLQGVLDSADWRARQRLLAASYSALAEQHNALGVTEPIPTTPSPFPGRGYRVLDVAPFIRALRDRIEDPVLRAPQFPLGGIDQFIAHARINHENYVHRELRFLIR